jgi:ribosomal-protein-alanine N-acetyltransferase
MYSIEQAAYPVPWTRGILLDCLRIGYACFGLQLGKDLIGYTIFNWAAGEAHLLNLCIDPKWQKKGYGSLLLEYTIGYVARKKNKAMFLEVRVSNPEAISLYENRGFVIIGRRPDYYQASEGREDAIVMRLELASETAPSP